MFNHYSVLSKEVINNLNIKSDGVYVDATLGGAGHCSEIFKYLSTEGKLICFDQDKLAIDNAKEIFNNQDNVYLIKSNFINLENELNQLGINKIDGIIFDLGVSSMQIDLPDRGFSYTKDGPLDMRMDTSQEIMARDIINNYPMFQLIDIFEKYGEEKFAKLYARAIVDKRQHQEFTTTKQLSDLILDVIPTKFYYQNKSHPAIRVFQALRIEVNKELEVFESALSQAFKLLAKNGRIAVITFHSLEDRICKHYFKKISSVDSEVGKLPFVPEEYKPKAKVIHKKPILPSETELLENSRSKSAKLRILERITDESI